MKPLLSPNTQKIMVKVLWITLAWTLVSIFHFLIGYQTLQNMDCDLGARDPWVYFNGSLITGISAGLLGGYGMVTSWEKWLRTKSYRWALISIIISYTAIYLTVSLITGLFVYSAELQSSIFNRDVWYFTADDFLNIGEYQSYLIWLFVVLCTLIFLQVNDKYGPGTFLALLKGKYFRPRREQRIFMFLDLRSSTTIAEVLKEERYFEFLKDVFKHTTAPILNARGEIYQYVGDEIVVSWPLKHGLRNANCLNCFFEVQNVLRDKTSYYQQTYQVTPEFKAGLHYGFVMAGEIGLVKRDIAFSGDVLNTTSRIQEKCNELGVNILISHILLDKLKPVINSFAPKKIGDMLLRGKQQQVSLFTV